MGLSMLLLASVSTVLLLTLRTDFFSQIVQAAFFDFDLELSWAFATVEAMLVISVCRKVEALSIESSLDLWWHAR